MHSYISGGSQMSRHQCLDQGKESAQENGTGALLATVIVSGLSQCPEELTQPGCTGRKNKGQYWEVYSLTGKFLQKGIQTLPSGECHMGESRTPPRALLVSHCQLEVTAKAQSASQVACAACQAQWLTWCFCPSTGSMSPICLHVSLEPFRSTCTSLDHMSSPAGRSAVRAAERLC